MILLPLLLPALMLQAETQPFDFDHFKATRIHPKSDPALVACLEHLHRDCPSFRAMLARFAREQPNMVLLLRPMEVASFGDLNVFKTPGGYLIVVQVQSKLARMGLDAAEPWLGSLLSELAEVSRNDHLLETDGAAFVFNATAEADFWACQRVLRDELMKANKKLKLASNGKHLYHMIILHKTVGL